MTEAQDLEESAWKDVSKVPLVTVLIGVYNNADTLDRAIDSILRQTVTDLELLVIDDGSSDRSVALARRAADRDARVRVLEMGRNVGISRSLNEGLRAARSPFVAVQDADDWSESERLERQIEVLREQPDIAVVGSLMREVEPGGKELAPRTKFASGDVTDCLMRFNPIPNTSCCMRREAVLAIGGYDPAYRYAMEYDLWLRLAERWRLVSLPQALSTREMSTTNVAARAERAQTAEAIKIRVRALRRRHTLRGVGALLVPAIAWLTPLALKRMRRRLLGQAQ